MTTIKFDFYEPTGAETESNLIFGFAGFDGARYDLNSTGRRASATLNNGTIGGVTGGTSNSYNLDTAYTIHMILNDPNAAVSYAGGTLGSFSAHVWIDNYSLSEGTGAIPEPTTALLGGLGMLALMRRHRA